MPAHALADVHGSSVRPEHYVSAGRESAAGVAEACVPTCAARRRLVCFPIVTVCDSCAVVDTDFPELSVPVHDVGVEVAHITLKTGPLKLWAGNAV